MAAKAARKTKAKAVLPAVLEVTWTLEELPTSQHRAGLAGLVLMAEWVGRQEHTGTLEFSVTAHAAMLRCDAAGMQALMDAVYAASEEEQSVEKPWKDKAKNIKEPLRTEQRKVTDKRGKEVEKTFYVYPVTVPDGAVVRELDPTLEGKNGLWVKLWRDLLWGVLRGIPAQRLPYEERGEGKPYKDAAELYEALALHPSQAIELPSTFFLGAQAKTAENVGVKDIVKRQFLLHFWPFAIQIHVPVTVDPHDGKNEFSGFAVAFPDVCDLEGFCASFGPMMCARAKEKAGYRPRGALVDLPLESGMDTLQRLALVAEQIGKASAGLACVQAIDVVHVEKQGNNVRVRGLARVVPDPLAVNQYAQFKGTYWNPFFRRQRLKNLIDRKPWYTAFLPVFRTLPQHVFFSPKERFPHDAREAFKAAGANVRPDEEPMDPTTQNDGAKETATEEVLAYRMVGAYLLRRLASKYGLRWEDVKGNDAKKAEYNEKKQKIALDAFLACRSRSGKDFAEYFTSTLCSVPQFLPEEDFLRLSRALLRDPDTIRTLTMLALSARA
ncbi:MAG: type I-MYXAN CRISPR-associated protein Cmx8 [Deltaproteobacteria bacterium]|nr:type I-MYXAN CRISPR-associated protein Cmx8 [Deltaproteobacteria bacterium]